MAIEFSISRQEMMSNVVNMSCGIGFFWSTFVSFHQSFQYF